jgi:hypothetical protein
MVAVWLRPPNATPSDAPDVTVDDWAQLKRVFEESES